MTCVSLKTDQEIQNGLQSSYNIYVGHNFIDEPLQKKMTATFQLKMI